MSDHVRNHPNIDGRLRDLLRYYKREADGEEQAAEQAEEPAVAAMSRTACKTWRRAAILLEAEIER